jgi:hypothetical protein
MSIFSRFARRSTPVTLADLATQYLAQDLPDISGIFSLPQASSVTAPVVEEESVATPQGLTAEQLALLYPERTRGGDGPKGGGRFGNLDMTRPKEFNINGEIVVGYPNLSSGLYQDIDGLNIQNLGIRGLPGITGILDSFRTSAPKYPGYFDYYNAGDLFTNPKSFFNFYKQPTPQEIVQQRGLAKQNMADAREITERIQKQTPPTPQDIARGGGNGGGNTSGGNRGGGTFGDSVNDAGSFSDYS